MSLCTVGRRVLELTDSESRFKRQIPFVNAKNRRRRVRSCMDRLYWTNEQRSRFMFSDKSPFVLCYHGKIRVWPAANENFYPVAITGSVNVWGCFCASGVGNLNVGPISVP